METKFVCDMTALDPHERARHHALAATLRPAILGFEELADGYAARFPREPERVRELAEFVTYESRCCPFLTLAVELAGDGGPLRLRVTGAPGVKPFIRAEFGIV
jgi:hypothetical protein